jgi:hypothetical protein
MSVGAAIISSFCEVVLTQPLDVLKIKMQTKTPITYTFRAMYAGFLPRALGNIPSRSIFLLSQDFLKRHIGLTPLAPLLVPLSAGLVQTVVDTPVEVLKMIPVEKPSLYKGFLPHLGRNVIFLLPVYNFRETYGGALSGAIGGLLGAYLSHPLDTIKTRQQTGTSRMPLTIRDYYTGCHVRAGMSMISMFISLSLFDLLRTRYNSTIL